MNQSADFFRLPSSVKVRILLVMQRFLMGMNKKNLLQDTLALDDPQANRGYVKIGREQLTQSTDAAEIAELRGKAPDMKETMEIGRDEGTNWKNHWPQESDVPGFKQTMLDFFKVRSTQRNTSVFATHRFDQICNEIHRIVMRAIALGLDLDEMYFEDKVNEQYQNLRLLWYPPIKTSLLKEGQSRAGAHSGVFPFWT